MENTLCTAVNNGGDLSPVLFSKFERQANVSLSTAPQQMSGGHSKKSIPIGCYSLAVQEATKVMFENNIFDKVRTRSMC